MSGKGYDLSAYKQVEFWARANRPSIVKFKVGGMPGEFGDSQAFPEEIKVTVNTQWQMFSIGLENTNLSHTIGGFCISADGKENPRGFSLYLDEIVYK